MSCKHAEDVCQDWLEKKVLQENEEKLENEIHELRCENIQLLKEKLSHRYGKTAFFISLFAGIASGIAFGHFYLKGFRARW